MPGYHESLLGYCLDGVGAVYFYCIALIVCLILGSFFGLLITEGGTVQNVSGFHTLLWFGGMIVGVIQFWGLLSYFIIAMEAVALFRAESHRWLILLSILLIQTCETSRMMLDFDDRSVWLQALAVLGILLVPLLHIVLYVRLERVPEEDEAIWTHCRSCGYNLTGTLMAYGTKCPECGETVSQYQHVRSVAERRKHDQGSRFSGE